MTMELPRIDASDPKQSAILAAAFEAFGNYGFRRTSMEDIARGAGMSRAALYLHYKNKTAIFRALVQAYYDQAVEDVHLALKGDGSVQEALMRAFEAQTGPAFAAMLASPHGRELMDTKHSHSADIAQAGEARVQAAYAKWLQAEATAGRIDLESYGAPEEVAVTLLRAFYGLKDDLFDAPDFRLPLNRLARMFGKALAK